MILGAGIRVGFRLSLNKGLLMRMLENDLYEVFIEGAYIGIKTNIDPVQSLIDTFMEIVANPKTVRKFHLQ